jgi:hypothetical protein
LNPREDILLDFLALAQGGFRFEVLFTFQDSEDNSCSQKLERTDKTEGTS